MVIRLVLGTVALATLAAGTAARAAGSQSTPVAEAGIAPLVWEWSRLTTTNGAETIPDDPSRYTVQFLSDGIVQVRADCNRGSGQYRLDGTELTVGAIATTRMACGPDSLDSEFLTRLAEISSFAYEGEQLVLALGGNGGALRFRPSLLGVGWAWTALQGGSGPDDPSRYLLTFQEGGQFLVRADCNTGRGQYRLEGVAISLTVGPLTRAMCPPGSRSNEFLDLIQRATRYRVEQGQLHLELPDDAGAAIFTAMPPSDQATPSAG